MLEAFPAYDANGNPNTWTHEGAPRTLRWDALDRLVAIEGSFSASYVYDPLGRRIAKTELTITTRYQYDGLDVVAEYGTTSAVLANYVFGPGIDEPLKAKRGTTVAAYHSDGLGSVRLLSQVGGAAGDLASYSYDAFGEDQGSTGGFANAYTFTGRERDGSGLLYYRARYYLPRAGRFLTPDPLGLAGGINPYAYAGSNPVNFTDPFGLTPIYAKASYGNATSPVSFPAFLGSSTSSGGNYYAGSGSGVANVGAAPVSQGGRSNPGPNDILTGSGGFSYGTQVGMIGPVPIGVWGSVDMNTRGVVSTEGGFGVAGGAIHGTTLQGGVAVTAGQPGRVELAFIAEMVIPGLGGYGPVFDARVSLTTIGARVQIGGIRGSGAFGFVGLVVQGPSAVISHTLKSSGAAAPLVDQTPYPGLNPGVP